MPKPKRSLSEALTSDEPIKLPTWQDTIRAGRGDLPAAEEPKRASMHGRKQLWTTTLPPELVDRFDAQAKRWKVSKTGLADFLLDYGLSLMERDELKPDIEPEIRNRIVEGAVRSRRSQGG